MRKAFIAISFFVLTFLSWNYIGLLFIPTFAIFVYKTKSTLDKPLYEFLSESFFFCLLFNIAVTYWLLEVTWWESVLAYLGNSCVMTLPILFTYILTRRKPRCFYLIFTINWLFYEFLHTKWDFAWPWLTLGNSMGNNYYFVQWYSLSGVYSGSLWILVSAALISYMYEFKNLQKSKKLLIISAAIALGPVVLSLAMFYMTETRIKNAANNIAITTYIPSDRESTNYLISKGLYTRLKGKKVNPIVVCPEVFLAPSNAYSNLQKKHSFYLDKYLSENPNSLLVYGQELKTKNTLQNAFIVKSYNETLFRLKQKYVPIREYTPKGIEALLRTKSYFTKNTNDFTIEIKKKHKFTPLVCYESLFSLFPSKLVTNSDFIILGTSEEFMNDSNIAKTQYLNIVRLRAIETQKTILKCSNKGISCVITRSGGVQEMINKEVTNVKIEPNPKNSIYQLLILKASYLISN